MLWAVPKHLIMSLPKTPQQGAACAAPPVWANQDRVLLVCSAGGGGKPPQLSLTPEVGMALLTLEGTTEEGIVAPTPLGTHTPCH